MRCVACGRASSAGARFCKGCGRPLVAPAPRGEHAAKAIGEGLSNLGRSLSDASRNLAVAAQTRAQAPSPQPLKANPAPTTKPLGLVLSGLYAAALGLVNLLLGVVMVLLGPLAEDVGRIVGYLGIGRGGGEGVALTALGVAQIALGLLLMAGGYGIGALQAWGRGLVMGLFLLLLPVQFFGLFVGTGNASGTLIKLCTLGATAAVLLYLCRPDVRERFV